MQFELFAAILPPVSVFIDRQQPSHQSWRPAWGNPRTSNGGCDRRSLSCWQYFFIYDTGILMASIKFDRGHSKEAVSNSNW